MPTQALSAERLTAPLEVTVRREPPAAFRPVPPPAAPPSPPVPAPPAPPKDRSRSSGPLYLFGAAALLAAIAFLLWIWRSPGRREDLASAAPGATPAPAATLAPKETASMAPAEVPTMALPTPGPAEAADAIVGATRIVETTPAPTRARPTPRPAVPTAAPPPPPTAAPAAAANTSAAPPAERAPAADDAVADKVYRTRRFAKFSASPDQARLYLDGRYTGIVDDWDDRGGGKTLPFATEGRHRVRLELPGYRTIHLDVIVTPEADDETVEIDDELKRLSKVDYPKLKGPAGRTDGLVIFSVVPPSAIVSENGRALGPASAFGPASPLKLTGPMVHDLEIAAAGFESRVVRILVSSNADRPQAVVTVALKALPAPSN